MARAPLLQISGIGLGFGAGPLFDDLDLVIQPGDRLALVGRNGSGKSTLLRVMAGLVEPDRGSRVCGPGVQVGYLEQDPDFAPFDLLGDFAAAGLAEADRWRVAAAAEGLGLDLSRAAAHASGGERRRAALARLVASEADLLLLDEPTNHLDIAAIEWLERWLDGHRGGYVVISHDRAFLRRTTRGTLWIDRGAVRRSDRGFERFEEWRETVWAEEDALRHKLDRRIKAESRWAVEGISARRKRNQGRLRALEAMRAERDAQIRRQGVAALGLDAAPASGQRVIEAREVAKSFAGRQIVRDLSLRVTRGDRVAIMGPNGAGKTTLLNLLTGALAPDRGTVTLGRGIQMAVFDQARAALDPAASLADSLTLDPLLGVPGRSDQVMVRGEPRHVVGYLKDFLFDEGQARAPVRALSGGERARLLLARIMAMPSNLLVLDEPTNDLDVETLDLLQEVLGDYDGTVLFVSHDRDFVDRVATLTIVMGGDGRLAVHAGGWSDALAQRASLAPAAAAAAPGTAPPAPARAVAAPAPTAQPKARPDGLSFSERHRLAALPAEIDRLGAEIAKLVSLVSEPDLYARDPARFAKATEALSARQAALAAAEDEWLSLAERAEG
jgi:ATP-binding cassette subfamily F protein uup